MNKSAEKKQKRERRHKRIRATVVGTSACPRLCVFRSNQNLYTQLIDDENSKTLGAVDSRKMTGKTTQERAKNTGIEIAKIAKNIKIEKVVFDRGGFQYAGSIKALADGAREGGLIF
jgi:large subunit ribosomal protein L18